MVVDFRPYTNKLAPRNGYVVIVNELKIGKNVFRRT